MTTNPFTADHRDGEPLAEGGTWLLDLVAAVDHLRRGHRPGLTVWDALEEALRWNTSTVDESVWDTPDPLASTLRRCLDQADGRAAVIFQTAVRQWVTVMAGRYNDGHHWPHPAPRRQFPPPWIDPAVEGYLSGRRGSVLAVNRRLLVQGGGTRFDSRLPYTVDGALRRSGSLQPSGSDDMVEGRYTADASYEANHQPPASG